MAIGLIADRIGYLGYAGGALLLLAALIAEARGRLHPGRANLAWALFGSVLLLQSLLEPGNSERLLGFACLWGAWLAGYLRDLDHMAIHRLIGRGVLSLAVIACVDTIYHLGRPEWINANIYAALIVLGSPYLLDPDLEDKYLGLYAVFLIAALIITGSRGAIAGVMIGFLELVPVKSRSRWVTLTMIAAAVMIVLRPGTVIARLDHWAEAWRLFLASPLIGIGPGNYRAASMIPNQIHADSAILTLLSEQGLAGLAAIIPLGVLSAIDWRRRAVSPMIRLSLIATLIQNLVDMTWLSPFPALILGWSLGVVWRSKHAERDTHPEHWSDSDPRPDPATIRPALE